MERLTKRTKTGCVLMASEHEGKYTTEEWICMLQDRLADYEDPGVTPERVVWMKEVIEIAFDHDKSRAERAHELHVADKEGRVVVLPCKVGDAVWFARSAYRQVDNPIEATVTGFASYGTTGELIFTTMTVEGQITRRFLEHQIGKTAFLSFEEAERALEELKNV